MKKRKLPTSEDHKRAYALAALRVIRAALGTAVNPQTGKTLAEETSE